MEFDHIGVPAPAKREGMRFLESKRLWLTSPADHPFRVEWLWYEPESAGHFVEVDGAPVEFVQPY